MQLKQYAIKNNKYPYIYSVGYYSYINSMYYLKINDERKWSITWSDMWNNMCFRSDICMTSHGRSLLCVINILP